MAATSSPTGDPVVFPDEANWPTTEPEVFVTGEEREPYTNEEFTKAEKYKTPQPDIGPGTRMRAIPKNPRNKVCGFCDSGLKFKKCCYGKPGLSEATYKVAGVKKMKDFRAAVK